MNKENVIEEIKEDARTLGMTVQEYLEKVVKPILEKAWEIQQRTGKPVKIGDLVKELNKE